MNVSGQLRQRRTAPSYGLSISVQSSAFVHEATSGTRVTRWFLPDMGFTEPGQQYIFMNGVDLGFELVY